MKVTIDVPDDVLGNARVFVAACRTTLRELVVQGLKQVMEDPTADEEKQLKAAIVPRQLIIPSATIKTDP